MLNNLIFLNQLDFGLTYCSNSDLLSLIKKYKTFNLDKAAFYAAEITLALEYMHSKNVIHRYKLIIKYHKFLSLMI